MKKLSKILESIWSDMQDRGTGDVIKKEEDFTKDEKDILVRLYLLGYIKRCVFTYKNPYDFSIRKFEVYFDDEWEHNHRYYYQLDGEDMETKKEKAWSYFTRNWDKGDNIQKKVEDKINEYEERISKMGLKRKPSYDLISTLNYWWYSLDDDQKKLCFSRASEFVSILNQDELDELDEWDKRKLDLKWSSFTFDTKLSAYDSYTNWSDEIDESIWSDMQDRGTGDIVKKEDDVNNLDIDGLGEYILDHYSIDDGNIFYKDAHGTCIGLSIFYLKLENDDLLLEYFFNDDYNKMVVTTYRGIEKYFHDMFYKMKKEYRIYDTETPNGMMELYGISPKDGREVDNKFFLEILDFIIDNFERIHPKIRKIIDKK